MTKILITSGPTRQYIDPVRYLTNASSGKMGRELTQAALDLGYEVVVVSGPVEVTYPKEATVVPIQTTEELLAECQRVFPECDGLIGAAAPSDYRPEKVADQKLSKTGGPLVLHLVETPDVVATLCAELREDQWAVGFALETTDARFKAITKLQKKMCNMIVLNGPTAMNSDRNKIEIIDRLGDTVCQTEGTKREVAREILRVIDTRLVD